MIIDLHAHALGDRFLSDLCMHPIAGMSCQKDGHGGYLFRRPIDEAYRSLDKNLSDLGHRLESLKRRKVERQLFGPPPGQFLGRAAWHRRSGSMRYTRNRQKLPQNRKD